MQIEYMKLSISPLSAPKKCSTSASHTPPATLPVAVTRRSLCRAPTEVEERMTSLTCEGGREGGREGEERFFSCRVAISTE